MANKLCKQCGAGFEVSVSKGNHRYCVDCRVKVRQVSHGKATAKYVKKKQEAAAKRPKLVACIDCGKEPVLRIAGRKTCEKCVTAARLKRSSEYAPRWRAANPEKFKLRQAAWRERNKDKIRQYYESDKETGVRRQHFHNARASKVGSVGTFTPGEWNLLLWLFGWHCAYCLKASDKLTVDHVIPLHRGGSNLIENILPACFSCNTTKRFRTEWLHRPTGEHLRVVPYSSPEACGMVEVTNHG